MDVNLLNELQQVADSTRYVGEVKAAIVTSYATIRAAQIITAAQQEKKDETATAA